MSDYGDTRDYEVGYRKPPISAMFPKGVSGNPSGRPKKAPDFESQLLREFDSKLKINENGKRISVTKFELLAKQLVNKAVTTGNVSTIRLLLPYYQQALDKAAEQWQKSTSNSNLDVRDLTTDELLEIIKAGAEESAKAKLEKSIEARLRKSIKAELEISMRSEFEKSFKGGPERSTGADTNRKKRGSRPKATGGKG